MAKKKGSYLDQLAGGGSLYSGDAPGPAGADDDAGSSDDLPTTRTHQKDGQAEALFVLSAHDPSNGPFPVAITTVAVILGRLGHFAEVP